MSGKWYFTAFLLCLCGASEYFNANFVYNLKIREGPIWVRRAYQAVLGEFRLS